LGFTGVLFGIGRPIGESLIRTLRQIFEFDSDGAKPVQAVDCLKKDSVPAEKVANSWFDVGVLRRRVGAGKCKGAWKTVKSGSLRHQPVLGIAK
jgi:hypothetical protein